MLEPALGARRRVAHFFRAGERKYYPTGVTYGPLSPASGREPFASPEQTARDLELIRQLGANLLRVYHPPPRWFLDLAAASQIRMKLLPGVSRAGIAVVLPSFTGPIVLCDAGANIAPKAHHLLEYAITASAYARYVLRIDRPRVALLSVGEEDVKGTTLVQQTHDLLRGSKNINFVSIV